MHGGKTEVLRNGVIHRRSKKTVIPKYVRYFLNTKLFVETFIFSLSLSVQADGKAIEVEIYHLALEKSNMP